MEETNDSKKQEIEIENRTLEKLLKDLREERGLTYIDIVEKLSNMGIKVLDEKKVKKWELGLEYPDTDVIYKLAELYSISSGQLIMARNNSFKNGVKSLHISLVKWISYFTGVSVKVALIGVYVFLGILLVLSFIFFLEQANNYMQIRMINNH